MRKLLIVFIILVLIITFMLTRSNDKLNEPVVSDSELNSYRQRLITSGLYNSEEDINEAVNSYVEMQTIIAKEGQKGMSFGKALKVSVIISASTMLFIFVIIQFSNAHTIEKYHLYRYINDPSKFWKWTKFWH